MTRASTAAVVLLSAAAIAGCDGAPGVRDDPPNVLLVVFDTTRDDFVGRRDMPRPTTPTIDRLAAEGVRFTQAYSVANWTLPAHATLLTGLYPSQAGATSETKHLPEGPETLAERLRDAGYATRGASTNPWIATERGFGRGFDAFHDGWRPGPDGQPDPRIWELSSFVRETVGRGERFFVFLNLNAPHLPYDAHPAIRSRFVRADRPSPRVDELRRVRGGFRRLAGLDDLTEDDVAILRELYAAEIHAADAALGELIAAVVEAGALDDTLVVVTSDHGENIGEHGKLGHELCRHETTLRVPLVVRYPARFPAARRVEHPVSLVDVMPTVLDLTATGRPDERARVEAASLARALDRPPRAFVIAETARPLLALEVIEKHFPTLDGSQFDHRTRVVREGRYKLIWDVGKRTRLYDLETDPGELVDRIGELPEVEAKLTARLRDWMSAINEANDVPRFDTEDPEALERLRSLGYIQ